MENEWDDYAEGWDQDPGARAYAAAAFASLIGVLQAAGAELADAVVLDFGCGTGLLTERLVSAGATVDAIDTSPAMLEVLNAKINERGWADVRTSTELPAAAVRFDVVVCSSVCSFLDDYPGTVIELVSRLNPGGIFVQWDWERPENPDGEDGSADDHGLARDEIRAALEGAGLHAVTVDTAFEVEMEGMVMAPLVGHGQRLI